MSRVPADERVRRLLAVIPYVASRLDGVPIDELCTRFRIDRKALVGDLTTASFVGVAPYTPDTQIDVVVEDGRVRVRLPQWFDRPLKLNPDQALALVAAGRSLLSVPGADPEGPLARALAKLAATLGVDDPQAIEDALDIRLTSGAVTSVPVLEQAIAEHRRVRLSYYTYGRDEHTERDVEPYRLSAERGQLYLWAHCREAGDDRVFRVDRIDVATLLDDTFVPRPAPFGPDPVFQAGPEAPRVTLDLSPAARWVADQYPLDERVELPGGALRVTLAVTARPWLERLLLRLGPDARLVGAAPDLAYCAQQAASRVLARYRRPDAPRDLAS